MAKILLNVELNAKGAQSGLDQLKQSLGLIVDSLKNIQPNKDLTAQLNALAKAYNALAREAQQVEKSEQERAALEAKLAKLEADAAKAEAQRAKAVSDVAKAAANAATAVQKEKEATEKANAAQTKAKEGLEKLATAVEKRKQAEEKTNQEAAKTLIQEEKLELQAAKTAAGIEKLSDSEKEAAESSNKLGDAFDSFINRLAKGLVSSALNSFRRNIIGALEEVGETLVKTEDAVIELNRVLDNPQPAQEISNRLYDLAYQYGSTFENASTIAANFARAGKSWNDSLQATEAALLAMNVAELNATEASDGLLSIIAQFNMEASDLTDVVDKLNKTADKNPVSTKKLLQAIQRAGSAANNANVSFDQTLGLITAISEATNRSGQNIGTAINSLIQYSTKNIDTFRTLSKESDEIVDKFKVGLASIVDVWNQVSIDIKNDKEARDNIISALGTDGLEELTSSLHDELGDLVEEMNGVYDVANTYRKNYFIALLDNMDRYMTVQEQLTDYQGYSQEENAKYMETYTAKVNQLNDAWQKLANDEQGILGFKKWLVETGIDLVDLVDKAGGIVPVVAEIAEAIALVSSLVKAGDFAKKILEIKANLTGVEVQTVATKTAVQGLSTAFSYLSIGTAVISGLITLLVAYNRNQEEARQKTIETAKAHEEDARQLKELSDKYRDLNPDSEEYREVESKILEILGEKAELLPELTKGTDEYRQAVENLTDAQLAQYRMEQEAAQRAARSSLENDANGVNFRLRWSAASQFYDAAWENAGLGTGEKLSAEQILDYYDKLIQKQDELAASYERLLASGDNAGAEKVYKQWEANGKQIDAVRDKVEAYKNTIESSEAVLDTLDNVGLKIWTIDKQTEELKDAAEEAADAAEEAGVKYDKAGEGAEKFAESISADVAVLKAQSDALKAVQAAQEEYVSTGALSAETYAKLASLGQEWVYVLFDENGAVDLTSDALDNLIQKTEEELETNGLLVESTSAVASVMKDLSTQIDEVQSAIGVLDAAQQEYDETGSLSIDTLQKLLELGSDYLALIIDEEGQVRLNEDAVNDLVAAKKELLDQLIAQQVEEYALNRLHEYMAQSTEAMGDEAATAAGKIELAALALAHFEGNEEGAKRAAEDFEEALHRLALSEGAYFEDWEEDWVNDVKNFREGLTSLYSKTDTSSSGWKSTSSSSKSSSSSSSKSTKDEYLESLKSVVSLRESELTLMEHQGASQDEQFAKIRQIQDAIHDEADYLRSIGASQEEINKLSSEWWKWEEKIVSTQEKAAENAKKAAENAEKERQKAEEEAKKAAEEAVKAETSRLKQVLADDKARLTLMEKQGKSVSDRVAKMKEIQDHLHDEAEWLRKIGAAQSEIDALSAEWWDWQEKILKLYKETLETQKQIELDAIQKTIDGILKEIDLEEEALDISEKRLAVDKARANLEEAITKAKIDYVQTVLSDYLTALDDAETLEEKQRAVAEAREKLVQAQREEQAQSIIDTFKAERDVKNDTLTLEEKRLAVEKARQALADAENDRTVRVYNEASGQWEYQANAKEVQSAKDSLKSAVDALNSYVEEQAWNEVAEAVENGSVSEAEVLQILEKWSKESYGNDTPEFVAKIQAAFRKAMGTAANPDSVSGQISAVDSAVKSLNDYLKQEAVKELKAYIAAGNTDAAGMRLILNKWLSLGEGGELYSWRDGLLRTVTDAIASGYYDDTKVQSQVEAVENAIENLHDYLRNRFIREIEDIVRNGTADQITAAIEKWSQEFDLSDTDRDWAERLAGAKGQYESTEAAWDEIMTNGQNSSVEQKRNVWQQMKDNSEAWWNATSQEEKDRLAAMNLALGSMMGWKRDEKSGIWYDEEGRRLFDKGGILTGTGGIKATSRPEIILDPQLTSQILKPGSEAQFRAFADAMHLMFERGDRTADGRASIRSGSNVDSHNTSYTVNGIPIGANMAERYTIAELFRVMPLVGAN